MGAWRILIEASALNAEPSRVSELAAKWGCNDADADELAKRCDIDIKMDGSAWCATPPGFTNLQECEAGFGETKLEALSNLARSLGYTASKRWGATFFDLVKRSNGAHA